MDNILILGAGSLQLPLIEAVKARGYNPVVMSLHADEPGMLAVKDTVIGDFCDEQLTLEVAKRWKVVAVITDQTDLPVRTISYVTNALGLPGIDYKTACIFTDKFLMREKCKEVGIKTIPYKLVDSLEEAIEFFKSLDHAAIIKPICNQGSKGIYKVTTESELKAKYTEACSYSRGDKLLVEEFITGSELVIEALVLEGQVTNLICGDTHYFKMEDAFAAKDRMFPSKQRKELVDKALDLNKRIISEFGLERGLTHAEYIIDGNEIYLIEIAARGGGVYISSDIIPLMTGLNTPNFIIDISTRGKVSYPSITYQERRVCYIAFFLPEGEIVNFSGVGDIVNMPFVFHNNLETIHIGKKIRSNTDKTSRFFMILAADTDEELASRISLIHSILNVEVLTKNGLKGIIWD